MMTKTSLSDGRRTRPRFAAPTPTPPKFLIGTIEQSENHSTPSKQTTNPNPNGHKSRFSRPAPPRAIAESPQRTRLAHPPRRIALCRISRPLSGLVPLAQPHPRNLDSPQRTSAPRPPWRIAASVISRPSSGLVPLALSHLRKKTSRRGFIPSIHGRRTSSLPFALAHPRNAQSARSRSAAKSKTPAGGRRYKNPALATEILIANLELEFGLTHTKLSPLRISNRKYFAIFYSDFSRADFNETAGRGGGWQPSRGSAPCGRVRATSG